jgi:dTDP-glucose 4,6-dehydratase
LRSKQTLGWDPNVSLVEGLSRTVNWYRNNEAWWRRILPEREVVVGDDGRKVAGLW